MLTVAEHVNGLIPCGSCFHSLCEIYRPDASPCAEVEDALRILGNRGKVELSVKKDTIYMMDEVHTILLIFIVGLRYD